MGMFAQNADKCFQKLWKWCCHTERLWGRYKRSVSPILKKSTLQFRAIPEWQSVWKMSCKLAAKSRARRVLWKHFVESKFSLSRRPVMVIVNCWGIKPHCGRHVLICTRSTVLSTEGSSIARCLHPRGTRQERMHYDGTDRRRGSKSLTRSF